MPFGHRGKGNMPFVNVKLIEGVFDADQKREIIERLTETMVEIEAAFGADVRISYGAPGPESDYL